MAVTVVRTRQRVSPERLGRVARRLLGAAPLCALATLGPGGRAHVNTMYFARAAPWDLIWLSAPGSQHSRNIAASGSAAIAIYDSRQLWGGKDRGIQVFGRARALRGEAARRAVMPYVRRFASEPAVLKRFVVYRLRPTRLKLFDEREFGDGTFVTARPRRDGSLVWVGTETYRD